MEQPYQKIFEQWLQFDEATKAELLAITDQEEIKDRFYKELEFGTGGLRGIMGAGTNRMNTYTVRKATYGLAKYLKAKFEGDCSVAIAYDSRNNSRRFADDAACVFCACGISTFLFDTLMPTPVLSFTVHYLNCNAGIVITASHNPKEYNGYKVYDQHGCQLVPRDADQVIEFVRSVTSYDHIPVMNREEALLTERLQMIGDSVFDAFLAAVKKQSIFQKASALKIVYTPLHGSGNRPVRAILSNFDVSVVKEQEIPDGNFPTIRSPNPEERDALSLALQQAVRENADIVLGTDPDCDRVGVGVKCDNGFVLLTGNQIGALLVDFVASHRQISQKSTLVKTIVTNELGANIGRNHGLTIVDTLTGFKYIGDQIALYEQTGEKEFVIGYEESFGYLVGTHSRDKDAVVASLLICEMAALYKTMGKTLLDVLENLYNEYGYYLDDLDSFTLKGADGSAKIKQIMSDLRRQGNTLMTDIKKVIDYSQGIDGLPKENVLKYIMTDGSWFAVRPSGTEPKIKVYYSIQDAQKERAQQRLTAMKGIIKGYMTL